MLDDGYKLLLPCHHYDHHAGAHSASLMRVLFPQALPSSQMTDIQDRIREVILALNCLLAYYLNLCKVDGDRRDGVTVNKLQFDSERIITQTCKNQIVELFIILNNLC